MNRNIDILARTITGEARGQGQDGMELVAMVVMNRCAAAKAYCERTGKKRHPLFGDGSPASACLAKWQFSCWNEGDPNRAIIENLNEGYAIFRQAINIAQDAVYRKLKDRTHGSLHYYAQSMKSPPKWAEGKTPAHVEARHLFFNNID